MGSEMCIRDSVNMQIKKSNENPMVLALYEGLLKGKTHQLLHRNLGVTEN